MASKKKKKRWIARIVTLAALAAAGLIAWSYLAPTLTSQSVTRYTPYTVEDRDIASNMSFGGTVSILHTQSVTPSESTTVREVYVQAAQSVSEGDKLIQLETGEVLTASIDGVVNQIRARAGGYAIEGMTLVQICDLVNMQISMSVDEYDISKLYIGQPCTVYILSLDMTFETQIAHLNRVSMSSSGVASYTASIELTVPEEVLPGMQASVTIPWESVQGAPALPVEAISYDENDQPYVYLAGQEGEYVKTPIAVGLSDGMYAQVLSGLNAGEVAYLCQTVEEAQEGFSLATIYKRLFGESVVINEPVSRSRGGAASGGDELPAFDGTLPEGMTLPEGVTLPEGATVPDGAAITDGGATNLEGGATITDGNVTVPDGSATVPDGAANPDDKATVPNGSATIPSARPDGAAAAADSAPAQTAQQGGE